MVDPGENVSQTVKREFLEEAMDSLGTEDEIKKRELEKMVQQFFDASTEIIYKGKERIVWPYKLASTAPDRGGLKIVSLTTLEWVFHRNS